VVLGLLLAILFTLFDLGAFLAEARARREDAKAGRPLPEGLLRAAEGFKSRPSGHPEELLAAEEVLLDRALSRAELLAKIGPMLGLMGTLIPLGPGLAALGRGDIQGLAEAVVVAFDTTVVGMAAGGVAWAIARVRRRWYAERLMRLELLLREKDLGSEVAGAEQGVPSRDGAQGPERAMILASPRGCGPTRSGKLPREHWAAQQGLQPGKTDPASDGGDEGEAAPPRTATGHGGRG
jgi:biopolymer transport protein ExbB/TolQ